uniref:Uncharacterized protein n=1 Tax=Timema douglasi TaxID=61478 RepID=A0A7R8VYH5_TIMDO|nr:unnamed protein product [Timema douglasi]
MSVHHWNVGGSNSMSVHHWNIGGSNSMSVHHWNVGGSNFLRVCITGTLEALTLYECASLEHRRWGFFTPWTYALLIADYNDDLRTTPKQGNVCRTRDELTPPCGSCFRAVFKFEGANIVCAAKGADFGKFQEHFKEDDRAFGYIRIQVGVIPPSELLPH